MTYAAAVSARAWVHAAQDAVCDVVEPWAHGTVVRATRYPSYWDFNVVRVEEESELSAEPLRAEFRALGWLTERLVWMRHEGPAPSAPEIPVEPVPYEAVDDLRVTWHGEDFPDHPLGDYLVHAREVALLRDAEVLAVLENDAPVAYALLTSDGRSTEIEQVYVGPDHRGRGLGTALTRAAISAAGDVEDVWIVADDEGRPKQLYARLGFRPVWTAIEALRLP